MDIERITQFLKQIGIMPEPKPIDDPQLRDKNTVVELLELQNKIAKSHIKNLDSPKQDREGLEKSHKS